MIDFTLFFKHPGPRWMPADVISDEMESEGRSFSVHPQLNYYYYYYFKFFLACHMGLT